MEGGISLFSSKPKRKDKPAPKPTAERRRVRDEDEEGGAAALNAGGDGDQGLTAVDAAPQQLGQGPEDDDAPSFRDLGLSEWLDAVCVSLGMREPTVVQRGCIPAILAGRDVLGIAHTGSGKTAAFALPILQHLAKDPFGVFALVLTPTRELAFQLADQFRALGAGMALRDCVVVGGLNQQAQAQELARRPHVVIATPGRLKALLDEDPGLARGFARARYLVLDEADRLLEPSFEAELGAILGALPGARQTLLFSATTTRALGALGDELMRGAYRFAAYEGLETAARLTQQYLFIPAKVKEVYLVHLVEGLEAAGVRSAIIFCSTCRGCHLLASLMEELELPAAALHSLKPQRARLAALQRFKGGGVPVLLATDVASRGLDIPTVDLVINYDLPRLARDYVHRVGRTARAGRPGRSLSLVTQYDIELVQEIEGLTGVTMEELEVEESEALKCITRVYAGKRAAALRVADEAQRGRGGGAAQEVARARKKAKRAAAAADGA